MIIYQRIEAENCIAPKAPDVKNSARSSRTVLTSNSAQIKNDDNTQTITYSAKISSMCNARLQLEINVY